MLLPKFQKLEQLVVLVKCFVAGLGLLCDPAFGGLGSYSIFCLCVSLLQHQAEDAATLEELLLKFFCFWGREFNSDALGVSLHNGGSFFVKSSRSSPDFRCSLVIEDPLDWHNNIGRPTYRWEGAIFVVVVSFLKKASRLRIARTILQRRRDAGENQLRRSTLVLNKAAKI